MGLCALLLLGFTLVEIADVLFRNLRRPWLNANEFAAGFFVWGVFLGMGVAVRRDQHFRLTAIVQIFFPNVVLWLPRRLVPTSVGCFPNPTGSGGFICPP